MEEIIKYLMNYGPLGVITAYFLYNDFQDRKANRQFMSSLMNQVNDHENRITALEYERE